MKYQASRNRFYKVSFSQKHKSSSGQLMKKEKRWLKMTNQLFSNESLGTAAAYLLIRVYVHNKVCKSQFENELWHFICLLTVNGLNMPFY